MKLYQVVLKDTLRRKRRVIYAILGVVIGTMTVVGILTTANAGQTKITAQLEKYGANLSLLPAVTSINTGLGTLNLGTVNVGDNYIAQDKIPQIRGITDNLIRQSRKDLKDEGNIATIAPVLFIGTNVNQSQVVVTGIDPDEEFKIKTWWQVAQGNYLTAGDQALLGGQVASLLRLKIGDTLDLNNTIFIVSGILEDSGSNEDYQIFVPLASLQKAFDKDGLISSIDIRALCNACPVETIASAINQEVSGVRAVAVKQIAAAEMGMLEKINNFMFAIAGITLVIGGFGVFNTLMTSINERKKDIGIMRAVGASRNQIIKALVYEAVVVGAAGGILGYLAGTVLAYIIGPIIFEGTMISFVPIYLPLSIVLALCISVLATLYPAFRATKVKVADSFMSI